MLKHFESVFDMTAFHRWEPSLTVVLLHQTFLRLLLDLLQNAIGVIARDQRNVLIGAQFL